MARSSITVLYFVLTFLAGAAVGSWSLWVYLMGFPSRESPAAEATAAAAPAPEAAVPVSLPGALPPAAAKEPAPQPAAAAPAEASTSPAAAAPAATPTPKGHWNTVDIPPRSHEECLALTKELNDAYKDCRFGVHQEVWVAE
jgi:hypothetical protein